MKDQTQQMTKEGSLKIGLTPAKQPNLLASSSNKLLIHQIESQVPVALQNSPHFGNQVNAVAWSHNNVIVATCGVNDNQICLARSSDGNIMSQFEVCPKGVSVTDICFSSRSSQIVFGCDDASMGILNIRARAVEMVRKDHDSNYSTKSVSFNCHDNLICTGCSDGEVIVYQVGEGEQKSCKLIFRDKSQKSALTIAKFSYTKRHVMASAYENGVVCIWDLQEIMSSVAGDIKKSSPLRFRFQAHMNACSGLAFSPVNNLLICSAGLDNKVQFFDIVEGKEVKKIDTGAPLSAISFCSDGHTIAVGTNQGGRVIIFDLKDSKKIKIELRGHDVSKKITSLQFSKLIKTPSLQSDKLTEVNIKSPSNLPLVSQSSLKSPTKHEVTPKTVIKNSKSPTSQQNLLQPKTSPAPKATENSQPIKKNSFVERKHDVSLNPKESVATERERIRQQLEQDTRLKQQKDREEEQQRALKAVIEATKQSKATDKEDFSSAAERMPVKTGNVEEVADISKMKIQIQAEFDKLRSSVVNDVLTDFNHLRLENVEKNESKSGTETSRRFDNVDMLDVAELEKQRDNEQQPISSTQLPLQGLTSEQKQLIDDIFEEKSSVFVSHVKEQFNSMHLELIRNFMQQETEVRAVLMKVARSNRLAKQELARLKQENLELRRINF